MDKKEPESINWRKESDKFLGNIKGLRHSTGRKDKLEEIGRDTGRLWSSLYEGKANKTPEAKRKESMWIFLFIGVGIVLVGLIYLIDKSTCDADCQEAREEARIERTVERTVAAIRTACEDDFDDWRIVERYIKDATRYPKTFEWDSTFLGSVGGYYQCAVGEIPYHTYRSEFHVSNQFGVPERHVAVVHLYPDTGIYEVRAFGKVIGYGQEDR